MQRRFGIEQTAYDPDRLTIDLTMPLHGLLDPYTGHTSPAPLAVLVDAACGTINHQQFRAAAWGVSSELRLELRPGFPLSDAAVTAHAVSAGRSEAAALSTCTLMSEGLVVGAGSVRSFATPAGTLSNSAVAEPTKHANTSLNQLMAISVESIGAGEAVLTQPHDPSLTNAIGFVHGGVAAAGLEIACSYALNHSQNAPFQTLSVTVNFLRPLSARTDVCRYAATVLHAGRSTAAADARAIDCDGRIALISRITAHR